MADGWRVSWGLFCLLYPTLGAEEASSSETPMKADRKYPAKPGLSGWWTRERTAQQDRALKAIPASSSQSTENCCHPTLATRSRGEPGPLPRALLCVRQGQVRSQDFCPHHSSVPPHRVSGGCGGPGLPPTPITVKVLSPLGPFHRPRRDLNVCLHSAVMNRHSPSARAGSKSQLTPKR